MRNLKHFLSRTLKPEQSEITMIQLADDSNMEELDLLAQEFYTNILRPEEEPGFVSDEASLLDISLISKEELAEKVRAYYGYNMNDFDFRRPFWTLLSELKRKR